MDENPWLHIPAHDYESHMGAAGQTAALRGFFARVYAKKQPARVAVLGCTTGGDLEQVDPAITALAVGVDINPLYLAIARQRLGALGTRLHLVQGDVLHVDVPPGPFDLVHAALLLEYVDPLALFRRISQWLSVGGTCSIVTQEPSESVPAVSDTGFSSLKALAGHMVLRGAAEVAALAATVELDLVDRQIADLAGGKRLVGSAFQKKPLPHPLPRR